MTCTAAKIDDQTGVWFLGADYGGLSLTTRDGDRMWSKSVSDLAEFVREKGIASTVMGSSTMDFADEEGFDTYDGAEEMWKDVLYAV
ncbi:MAG: hypothetical protein ACR2MS_06020 [Weeksellaceae bacterium]